MTLSDRALGILGVALAILLVALVRPELVRAAAVLDAGVLVACVVDFRRAGRLAVEVRRVLPEPLYQGTPADAVLEVRGTGRILVRDPLAPSLTEGTVTVEVGAPADHRIALSPSRRGALELGPVTGRVLGPWGLVWRPRRWVPTTTVRVLPRVRFDGEAGLYLRGQLQSRASVRPDRRRAPSGEIHSLRDYAEGDDVRRLQWSATARFRRPIVSELEWDRHAQVVLLLDGGRAMGTLDAGSPKLDHALAGLLALLRVATLNDDKVLVVLYSDRVRRVVTAAPGTRSWASAFDALYAEHSDGLPSDHRTAAAWVGAHVQRRSLVLLFTSVGDIGAAPTLVPALAALRRRHPTVLVDLEDPAVLDAIRTAPRDEAGVGAMASAWAVRGRNEEAAVRLRRSGIEVVRTGADGLMVGAVRRYVALRGVG